MVMSRLSAQETGLESPRPSSKGKPFGQSLSVVLGIAAITWLWAYLPATAQTPDGEQLVAQNRQGGEVAAANRLYVNASSGNDSSGNGSDRAPFRSLTRALQAARSDTVILLAPGTYSAETGETFPLQMKPGVVIQGDPSNRGRNVTIRGGGQFLSRSFSTQNVTIIGADDSAIAGVTITNPNPRGYGLWVESTSPLVADNTFTGSTHDGISVVGDSSPLIRNNYFSENGANGVTIYGTSQAELRENVFEMTGYAINVAQNAAPLLVGNQVRRNRSGIIIQGNGRPILRNNRIESNEQDGIVAISQALPNLGTASEPGGNIIRNNGQLDINATAAKQIIPAFGNELISDRTAGRIDLAGVASPDVPIATNAPPNLNRGTTSQPTATRPQTPPPPTVSNPPATATLPTPNAPISIPVPPPRTAATPTPPPSVQINSVSPAPATYGNQSDTLPVLLPVPNGNAPIGTGGGLQPVTSVPNRSGNNPPAPPSRAGALGLQFRVVVQTRNSQEENRVRSLVPQSFRTVFNGQSVMQAGVFSDRNNADDLVQMLQRNGLAAAMHEVE